MLLLNDETGQIIEGIEADMQSVANICRKILMKWLAGKGKEVTWEALLDVLKTINLTLLASDNYKGCIT